MSEWGEWFSRNTDLLFNQIHHRFRRLQLRQRQLELTRKQMKLFSRCSESRPSDQHNFSFLLWQLIRILLIFATWLSLTTPLWLLLNCRCCWRIIGSYKILWCHGNQEFAMKAKIHLIVRLPGCRGLSLNQEFRQAYNASYCDKLWKQMMLQ